MKTLFISFGLFGCLLVGCAAHKANITSEFPGGSQSREFTEFGNGSTSYTERTVVKAGAGYGSSLGYGGFAPAIYALPAGAPRTEAERAMERLPYGSGYVQLRDNHPATAAGAALDPRYATEKQLTTVVGEVKVLKKKVNNK